MNFIYTRGKKKVVIVGKELAIAIRKILRYLSGNILSEFAEGHTIQWSKGNKGQIDKRCYLRTHHKERMTLGHI